MSRLARVSTLLGVTLAAVLVAAGCASGVSHEEAARTDLDPLVGYVWRLVDVMGPGSAEESPVDADRYTLELVPDGSVVARVDCNRGHGRWKRDGSKLAFEGLAFTRAYCGTESLFDEVSSGLARVSGYAFRDGHLFLTEGERREILEFEPLPDEPGDAP
ncbi:MAG TPA: META domain-containing protein [Myxococcota bacterium]|jgi:heat shock protein HslJ|nr:META domain-containing protein [Myxococcota bacterium]